MSLIDKVLTRKEFEDKPPVLLDIGASGTIHKKWKRIAKYSICIAFDADTRDFNPEPEIAKKYRKLFIKNALVTEDGKSGLVDFYLTKSPYCSSLLKPNLEALQKWAFAPLFEIDTTVKLKCTDINTVLDELRLDRIDWFKSDSQGTDLRLFKSVSENIQNKILLAEFEPGILDAYQGEDKLHSILSYMDTAKKFWMADLVIKGPVRIASTDLGAIFKSRFLQKIVNRVGKTSPGWGEMTFINSLNNFSQFDQRDLLLCWVLSTLNRQHGFALSVARLGKENYGDPVFQELASYSTRRIRRWIVTGKYAKVLLMKLGIIN